MLDECWTYFDAGNIYSSKHIGYDQDNSHADWNTHVTLYDQNNVAVSGLYY